MTTNGSIHCGYTNPESCAVIELTHGSLLWSRAGCLVCGAELKGIGSMNESQRSFSSRNAQELKRLAMIAETALFILHQRDADLPGVYQPPVGIYWLLLGLIGALKKD